MKKEKEQKYRLTVTEHQLRLIANCVEDCHRFASGQMELHHTTCFADGHHELVEKLDTLQGYMTPELSRGSYYDWAGNHCPNDHQRKFIAETYAIYREIIHRLTVENHKQGDHFSVYLSPTLTCEEGGELPIIEKL